MFLPIRLLTNPSINYSACTFFWWMLSPGLMVMGHINRCSSSSRSYLLWPFWPVVRREHYWFAISFQEPHKFRERYDVGTSFPKIDSRHLNPATCVRLKVDDGPRSDKKLSFHPIPDRRKTPEISLFVGRRTTARWWGLTAASSSFLPLKFAYMSRHKTRD